MCNKPKYPVEYPVRNWFKIHHLLTGLRGHPRNKLCSNARAIDCKPDDATSGGRWRPVTEYLDPSEIIYPPIKLSFMAVS